MSVKIQVVLDENDRDEFRGQAAREGLSLSAWLRAAARERLTSRKARRALQTVEELDDFFAECDARETVPEPDWEEHLKVIEQSRLSGTSPT